MQSLSDGFQKELRKFDVERVLPAWDGLVRGQQARLEALEVPTMFVTSEAGDVEVRVFLPMLTWNFLLLFWLRVHGFTSRAHAKHALFY